jgi:hypothetical protein
MTDTLTEAVHDVMADAAARAIAPRYQHLARATLSRRRPTIW